MKNNSCHPQNWPFPLLMMVANIHLGSLFRDVIIVPPGFLSDVVARGFFMRLQLHG